MQRHARAAGRLMDILFGPVDGLIWPEALARLSRQPRREPFDANAVGLVHAISSGLSRGPLAKQHPELAALAHWFRPASLRQMEAELTRAGAGYTVRPRGAVFALAPANVDVLFIYGWLLSVLCGNATVVRASQKPSVARDNFLGLLDNLKEQYAPALSDSLLVSYPHQSSATSDLSRWCDLRLIWGGDATINAIRAVSLKPTAIEGAFADRFSLAAFKAETLVAASDEEIAELARRFANDTLWFGQQGCSSPRALFWVGEPSVVATAQDRFWPYYREASQRFGDEPAAMMSRLSDLFTMAALGVVETVHELTSLPAQAGAATVDQRIRDLHSGHGLFVEYRLHQLSDLAAFLADKDQTLVSHGFDADEVGQLAEALPNRALDRIVSVGQATNFATVWDGINLLDLLTRKVAIPPVKA